MVKLRLLPVLFVLFFMSSQLNAQIVTEIDSTSVDSLSVDTITDESDEVDFSLGGENLYNKTSLISTFNLEDTSLLFIHSDTLFRFGWCNDTIHVRRYDLTKKNDTTTLILQDCYGMSCYTPPSNGYVTSNFGMRRGRYHYGIDTKLYTGDTVYNAFDGIVRVSKYSKSYGNVVVIRHFNGLETLYAHLSKRLVEANKPIRSGDVIGLGGNTGRSHGSHLHFEVRYFGEPINPSDIIDFNNFCLRSDTLYLSEKNFDYQVEARKAHYYTIRNGDTLSKIARKNRTSVKSLCRLNNIKATKILRAGKRLRVA